MVDLSQRVTDARTAAVRPRLPSLTGMRFLAAIMVFCFHASFQQLFNSADARDDYLSIFSQGGWSGVSFFFMLSGFVLTWSVREGDRAAAFWRRRFFKVYPNHLLSFVAAFALITWVSGQVIDKGLAAYNLVLLQSWLPGIQKSQTVNTVSWSLSCEALFYLSFPLLYALISRIRPERLWAWWGALVAVIAVLPVVAATALPDHPGLPWTQTYSDSQWWLVYIFPPVRMLDFAIGIILCRIVITGRRLPLSFGGSVALAIAAYALAPHFPGTYHLVAVMIVPLGLIIVSAASVDAAGQRSWVSSRVMVRLGELSFAFYLWHRMVLVYGDQWISHNGSFSTPVAALLLALFFGITVVIAWLVYALVERPIMRRFGGSKRRGRPVTTEEPTISAAAA